MKQTYNLYYVNYIDSNNIEIQLKDEYGDIHVRYLNPLEQYPYVQALEDTGWVESETPLS